MLCLCPALAQGITLKWSSPTNAAAVTNYTLYAFSNSASAEGLSNAVVRVEVGTNLTCQITNVGTWWLRVRAMTASRVESVGSNTALVEVTPSPPEMRMVLQYSGTLTGWKDVGFFRVKLP